MKRYSMKFDAALGTHVMEEDDKGAWVSYGEALLENTRLRANLIEVTAERDMLRTALQGLKEAIEEALLP